MYGSLDFKTIHIEKKEMFLRADLSDCLIMPHMTYNIYICTLYVSFLYNCCYKMLFKSRLVVIFSLASGGTT